MLQYYLIIMVITTITITITIIIFIFISFDTTIIIVSSLITMDWLELDFAIKVTNNNSTTACYNY